MSQNINTPNFPNDLTPVYDAIVEKIKVYQQSPFEHYLSLVDRNVITKEQQNIWDIFTMHIQHCFEIGDPILITLKGDDLLFIKRVGARMVSLCIKPDGDIISSLFHMVNEPEKSLIMSGDYPYQTAMNNKDYFRSSVEFLFSII